MLKIQRPRSPGPPVLRSEPQTGQKNVMASRFYSYLVLRLELFVSISKSVRVPLYFEVL